MSMMNPHVNALNIMSTLNGVPGAAHEADGLLVAEQDRLAVVALEAVRAVGHPLEPGERLLEDHPLLPGHAAEHLGRDCRVDEDEVGPVHLELGRVDVQLPETEQGADLVAGEDVPVFPTRPSICKFDCREFMCACI